eukprot:TRINITY_DN20082_c0_g5_i1.p2 TRINITY_DN20082_c0_g5~~TRINITY_DN20082_c0_g5_i1.p2  ORF type:complete len:104 (+),score=4.26 TRINITY_DN20082_c0_g5_i1:91-402(+)
MPRVFLPSVTLVLAPTSYVYVWAVCRDGAVVLCSTTLPTASTNVPLGTDLPQLLSPPFYHHWGISQKMDRVCSVLVVVTELVRRLFTIITRKTWYVHRLATPH